MKQIVVVVAVSDVTSGAKISHPLSITLFLSLYLSLFDGTHVSY